MFKLILLVLALSCCALGGPHIFNRHPRRTTPRGLFRSVRDVSNDAPKGENSPVEQLEDSSNTTEESKTRHIREATDEPSEDANNALIDLNATLAITEGIFKLYQYIETHKQKLIKSSLSLVQDLLPGLELQITEIVGLAEIYLENIMHQAGHKLENATTIFKGTDGRPKRDLTYNNMAFPVDHPEVEDQIRAKRSAVDNMKTAVNSMKDLTEDLFSKISDKLISEIKAEEEEWRDYFNDE